MMDPVNPWLDADEVQRMAARLMQPASAPEIRMTDAGFNEGFVGFASERPASPTPSSAPPATPPPASLPEEPVKQLAPEAAEPPSSAARGPFLERLRRLRDWMTREFSANSLFILDHEGAVVFDESGQTRLYFLARSLALAPRRPGTTAANVHVKIGANTTLEAIPVETADGLLVLGALVPQALTQAAVRSVMAALAQAAAPQA